MASEVRIFSFYHILIYLYQFQIFRVEGATIRFFMVCGGRWGEGWKGEDFLEKKIQDPLLLEKNSQDQGKMLLYAL